MLAKRVRIHMRGMNAGGGKHFTKKRTECCGLVCGTNAKQLAYDDERPYPVYPPVPTRRSSTHKQPTRGDGLEREKANAN